jgi:putative flippase GtrA
MTLLRDTYNRLSTSQKEKLGEVVRFGIVGLTATLIQYAIYWLLIHAYAPSGGAAAAHTWATVAMTVGYLVSFAFNFVASTRFTFRVKASAKKGAGFALSHVVNYLLQMLTLNLFLWLGVPKQWAPIPMFCICVPVNFLLVRFFLKR